VGAGDLARASRRAHARRCPSGGDLARATSGIGLVTARALARRGARVVLVGRSRPKCDAALAHLQDQTGSREAEALLADLSVQQQVCDLARRFLERHARLDLLVNNAVPSPRASYDEAVAQRLWLLSERLTGLAPAAPQAAQPA
jgi:NAD(P)-dependent dehydrogenase (short-subunit alcohol dehydrogenase family)